MDRCYETAVEQLVGSPIPEFTSWVELISHVESKGFNIAIYDCPGIKLKDLFIDGYAIVTQRLRDGSLHASLTYCCILDKNNSGLGRQFATQNDPVEIITIIKPKALHVEKT